ncbi:hypothetical protein [Candidatus Nitrosocosmicus arcticus]|uniref:PepSY domain-containing protein n=1 Tax=Candidatus Nitrosocosmicus arcticus TaxID=2035267 RepID=A0A557SYQ3_9ARCH|nr:hypothetical protein [Candidatus Nitrosocosmicus arcticus]TVP41731.1 exported protein of unknown function [Candidatus Nitrosocosmicus arcticus]
MNIKISLNFVILAGLLTATIGILPLMNSNNAFAQTNSTSGTDSTNMTGSDNMMMMKDNYAKPMMGMEHKKYEKINGTLNMMETMYQAIGDKFNVTLPEAISAAEQSVGNSSFAMSAIGAEKDGFLVFEIMLGSPDMQFTKVLVDPGNGLVLQTEPISMMEWMSMMHSQGGHEDMGKKGMHSGQGYGEYDMGKKGMHSGQGYGEYDMRGGQNSGW